MNKIYGMAPVTFQHLATSRLTNKGKSGLTFYGRTATGESIAVHRYDIKPYGFIKCNSNWWNYNRPYIMEYLKWMACKDKIDSMEKFEQTERRPGDTIQRLIQFELKEEPVLTVTPTKGYNIRYVHESDPDDFMRVECEKSNTLRQFIKCVKSPHTLKTAITAVRKKMRKLPKPKPDRQFYDDYDSWVQGCKEMAAEFELPSMPADPQWDKLEVYETHIGDDLVWMTDNHLTSCGWMTATGGIGVERTVCSLDIEITNQTNWIKNCDEPPQAMAPYVILSYDIESQPHVIPGQRETEFPESNRDPILCIGVCVFNMVNMSTKQYCFMWEPEGPQCESYKPLSTEEQTDDYKAEDTDVRSFRDEYGMLLAFQKFIVDEIDPDIITGYNILNFDNVYTIERAQHLYNTQFKDTGIDKAWCWGRIKGKECQLKKKYTWTAQKGGKTTWQCRIEGREFMDLYKIVMDDHKLRSYKMDNVAKEFLGTQKIEIDYDDIPIMQQTAAGRERLGAYCAKDAWIPCQLIIKMSKATNAILMSQVAGVSLDTILNRGQQIRTLSLMLKKVKERAENGDIRWFIPDEDDPPNTGSFEGAVVITPIPGFWDRPVATLDFASLYPSIMRAWNMCFSTILSNHKEAKERGYVWEANMEKPSYRPVRTFTYPEGGKFEYQTLENDICFVTREQRRGILPELLEELHSERKLAKRQRKAFKEGSMEYNVLDGRQLALKVCMNSMYGFTGASKGFLPEKRIASAVTRAGRGMANETKFMCEDRYKEYGVKVVYGDTDSVFVHFPKSLCPGETREEIIKNANRIGEEMGVMCTKAFLPPNDLEFEKVYYPLLLKGKKRYAGFKYEPGCKPKLDVKGFECVRRDFAPIVSKTQKKVFVLLCEQNDVNGAVQLARQTVVDLLEGRTPLDDLILSKQLTRPPDQYKNPQPHVELAKHLQKILPATQAPKTGDRIDYIIKPGRGKTFTRAAIPDDVREGKCSIDYEWYLTNQLKDPLTRVFEMVIDNTSDIFKVDKVRKGKIGTNSLFNSWVSKKRNSVSTRQAKVLDIKRRKVGNKKKKSISDFF